MPRFTRSALLLVTLSVLLVPTGTTQAQVTDDILGSVHFGDAINCTVGAPPSPTEHQRCHTGAGQGFQAPFVELVAQRAERTLTCQGGVPFAIGFRTRETLVSGRGFLQPTHVNLVGVLSDPPSSVGCRVRLTGTFHREGTVAIGRLRIDITTVAGGADTFFHHYCARFEATAVPTILGGTAVDAAVEGRACPPSNRVEPEETPVATHGRSPDDDTRHG